MIVEELKHYLYAKLICNLHEKGQLLHTWTPCGGGTVHVVDDDGEDMLIVVSPTTGDAILIKDDHPSLGSSIHRLTRDALAAGLL